MLSNPKAMSYTKLKKHKKETFMDETNFNSKGKNFFAAANSGYGFYSFYDNIFEDDSITERHIIKGGPGTGKSRFMKEIAYAARKKGFDLETYSCSSDPSSLDGVVVNRPNKGRVCVLDGTAPHVCEASLPGARDTIINFCDFWDSRALVSEKERIKALGVEKQRAYLRASDSLRSTLLLNRETESNIRSCLNRAKIESAARKYLSPSSALGGYFERIGLCTSFGMFGEYCLDTYTSVCDDLVVIDNALSCADAFIEALLSVARALKIASYRSYSYLDPHKLDAIYFPSLALSFVSSDISSADESEKCRKHVSMQRFVDMPAKKSAKSELKSAAAAEKELRRKTSVEMEKMRAAHFEIEKIYISAMDFERKEEFCGGWIEENI